MIHIKLPFSQKNIQCLNTNLLRRLGYARVWTLFPSCVSLVKLAELSSKYLIIRMEFRHSIEWRFEVIRHSITPCDSDGTCGSGQTSSSAHYVISCTDLWLMANHYHWSVGDTGTISRASEPNHLDIRSRFFSSFVWSSPLYESLIIDSKNLPISSFSLNSRSCLFKEAEHYWKEYWWLECNYRFYQGVRRTIVSILACR